MTRMLVMEKAVMIKIPFLDLEHLSRTGSMDELDEERSGPKEQLSDIFISMVA